MRDDCRPPVWGYLGPAVHLDEGQRRQGIEAVHVWAERYGYDAQGVFVETRASLSAYGEMLAAIQFFHYTNDDVKATVVLPMWSDHPEGWSVSAVWRRRDLGRSGFALKVAVVG